MLVLLLVTTVVSLGVSMLLAIRLLKLARQTRRVPEAAIGLSFLLAGVIGYSLMVAGAAPAMMERVELSRRLMATGYMLISVGVVLTYLFTWRVFRPTESWAGIFFGVAAVTVIFTGVPDNIPALSEPSAQLTGPAFFGFWLGMIARVGSGAWGAAEAIRYYCQMRKRLAVGLAKPLVTNRFLLWGLASLAATFIFIVTSLREDRATIMTPANMTLISLLTLTAAISQWLAFFPPRRYVRWIERSQALGNA